MPFTFTTGGEWNYDLLSAWWEKPVSVCWHPETLAIQREEVKEQQDCWLHLIRAGGLAILHVKAVTDYTWNPHTTLL